MAALNPEIIRDTKKLISFYQTNLPFRNRFDKIVAQNINATYHGRPIKLYVEVLANISSKFKPDYRQIKTIVLHDEKGKVGELFKKIKLRDFELIDTAARAAEQNLNATSYSSESVNQINKIEEESKDNKEKREAHTKRIEEQKDEKEIIENQKTSKPEGVKAEEKAEQKQPEEKTTESIEKQEAPTSFINPEEKLKEEAPKEVFKEILPQTFNQKPEEPEEQPEKIIQQENQEPLNLPPENQPVSVVPNISDLQSVKSTPNFVKNIFGKSAAQTTEKVGVQTGSRLAVGKAVAGGAGQAIKKLGLGTAVKAGTGMLAKLGISAATGLLTGGVGFVVGAVITLATTFGDQTKKLFKLIFWIMIGLSTFVVFMFIFQRGMKMNSLLPPYDVPPMGNVGIGITGGLDPGGTSGNISSCTFYRSGDKDGSAFKFKINEWPILINYVASKVGIPPAILAAILRVECGNCFTSNNPAYVTGDYDSHTNGLVYGVMQFYPPTFESIFYSNKEDIKAKFGKTSVKTTIDPQDNMASSDTLRIYSIRDSLIAAAYKIKADAGMNPPYTKEAVDKIIISYFTQCSYQQGGQTYNYCDDVWKSYQECKPTEPLPTIQPGNYCGRDTIPTAFEEFEVGKTAKGTSIKGYKIGSGNYNVAIVAGMNGMTESQGVAVVNAVKSELEKGVNSNLKLSSNTTLYLIPLIDPDSSGGFNFKGVDINRNFFVDESKVPGGGWNSWGCSKQRYNISGTIYTSCKDQNTYNTFKTYCDKVGLDNNGNPTSFFYCVNGKTGSSAFSEPETQAIRNFITNKNINTVLSFRAPYNNVTTTHAQLSTNDPSRILAEKMAEWLGISYDPYFKDYPVRGQFLDWLYTIGVPAVEIEVPSYQQKYLTAIQNTLNYLSPGTPAAPAKSTAAIADSQLNSAIQDQYGIKITGFSTQQLRWVWEKLSDVSGTNFNKLIKNQGTLISMTMGPQGSCQQLSCTNIQFCPIDYETTFKVVLLHELGHIIYHCAGGKALIGEHYNLYRPVTGSKNPVTYYGGVDVSENYPEMLTYYLNPNITERTSVAYTRNIIPYNQPQNLEYFKLANKILCGN